MFWIHYDERSTTLQGVYLMEEYRKRCKECLTVTVSSEPLENGEPCLACEDLECVTDDSYLIDYWKPFPGSI